jgi:hypothetical protein
MAGSWRDRRISRLGSSNAGKRIAKKSAPNPILSSKTDKSALRQTADDRAPELPCGTSRCFLSPVDAVAKHLCHHFGSAKKMHLKTVRLFLGASFCVDAADIRF